MDGENPKQRFGMAKPQLSYIPLAAMIHEAQALECGANKYGRNNWRSKKILFMTYIDAALRHLKALQEGEDVDPESGVHHAGHARACLAVLLDSMENGTLIDDRPHHGAASTLLAKYTKSIDAQQREAAPVNGADVLGLNDRNGRPGRRADEQGEALSPANQFRRGPNEPY